MFSAEIEKNFLNSYGISQSPGQPKKNKKTKNNNNNNKKKTLKKKNKPGGHVLSDFKSQYKVMAIKMVSCWHKNTETNGI